MHPFGSTRTLRGSRPRRMPISPIIRCSRPTSAVDGRFVEPGRLVDLGCGAGRHSLRFAARGFTVTSVDLSRPMLELVSMKAAERGVELSTVQLNLCRLGCFPDQVFDYALSMFSTLGMIRGREPRRRRWSKRGGSVGLAAGSALHVHNFWLNLRDSQGRRWLWSQVRPALFDRASLGDRRMIYRGITGMKVHLYRWGELKRELRGAGLAIEEVLPLDEVSAALIDTPWFAHSIRAGGWIVFAKRR